MNDEQPKLLYAFMKTQEAWQEVDPDEYSYEASYIACCLILTSPSPSFEASYINMPICHVLMVLMLISGASRIG